MNTATVYKTSSDSPEATSRLGVRFGSLLRGGEVIELASDLGGGKTVFVKGLAQGLGYTGAVASPTFTVSRIYQLPHDLELHHFDFYRIGAGDVVTSELAETIGQPGIITAIEWGENASEALPADRLRIRITATGDDQREITVEALGPKHAHLLRGVQS